jgi:dTDP-4-amino-4,6-dideoxy-D-galactose acyltransferase
MSDFQIQKLTWDSTFFGHKIGKAETKNTLNNKQLLESIEKSSYDMVQVFSNQNLGSSFKYNPIDVKLTFSKKVPTATTNNPYIKSVTKDLNRALVKLATEAGIYSRYKTDKNLQLKFEEMYEIWMNKSLKRELAAEVFVFQDENRINGMVTINKKLKKAEIGLIAVDNKVQSKGIGTQLLQSVENWALKHNLENICVETQEENYNACQFYEKNNYKISDKTYIYHIWKNA